MVTALNQNRQFYVANAYDANVAENSNAGTLGGVVVKDGELYFKYKGAESLMRSDRINVKQIEYIKAIAAANMADKMKKVEVTLKSDVNSGAPSAGQDYILRIAFRQFYGMSDQDQYFKDIAVRATSAMTDAEDLFTAMVTAANLSFSRELGATATSNPYLTFSVSGSGSSAKLVIEEKEQPWTLGVQKKERVYFDVIPTVIYYDADDVVWGNVTIATPTTTVGNGSKIADLEYFCMGERGDQYRTIGWPNNIDTKYLVDATKTYNVLEIHYAFTDTGVNSYKSEKDITIVAPVGASGHEYDLINSIIGAINTAVGSTIVSTLS